MISFIDKYDLIHKSQFGFQKNIDTSVAINMLMNDLIGNLEKKYISSIVSIDLKKAFDTINHDILLNKLSNYGFRGVTLDFFSSYLNDRKQKTVYFNNESDIKNINYGVPQGSVLGPILFILFMNDLHLFSNKCSIILFADDTNIIFKNKNINNLNSLVTNELIKLKNWLIMNKLTINIEKSCYIIIDNINKHYFDNNIYIDNKLLNRVECYTFLGMYIDDRLNWKAHIDYICKRVSKFIAILHKLKFPLSIKSLKLLYNAFILPNLSYCITIWGNTYKSNINRIIILQNRAIRAIYNLQNRINTDEFYNSLNILKFKDIYKCKTILIMYDVLNSKSTSPYKSIFFLKKYNYSQRSQYKFIIPSYRLQIKYFSIFYNGPILWNNLENSFKTYLSKSVLKRNLKKRYINQYL